MVEDWKTMSHAKRKRILIQYKKMVALEILGGRCYICHRKYGKGFTFHHIRYEKASYRDFKTAEDYSLFVCAEVQEDPERFALLCRPHHHVIEMLKRYKQDKFDRLMLLAVESRNGR